MGEIILALVIMAGVVGVAMVITGLFAWYERYSAQWHHEMMLESFADGWDAACNAMKSAKGKQSHE
jgi:heme/copper-type cytochrome/quinol oxidase subunit 2